MRRILIEEAQHRPTTGRDVSQATGRSFDGVLDFSWEAQRRLCGHMTHYTNSGKALKQALAALARELVGFIWSRGQVSQLLA